MAPGSLFEVPADGGIFVGTVVQQPPWVIRSDIPVRALYGPGLPSREGRIRNYVQKHLIFVHGFPEVFTLALFTAIGAFYVAIFIH